MSATGSRFLAQLASVAATALAVPLIAPNYMLFELSLVLVFAIAILGLNLLMGFGGQISLAQGALVGFGAYVTALLNVTFGMPVLVTLPFAAAGTALFGVLVGLPALRLQGLQLAIVTFGMAAAFPQLLLKLDGLTRGVTGLAVDPLAIPAIFAGRAELYQYLVCLALTLLATAVVAALTRGDVGRALRAQRDNPLVAEALGVNLVRARLAAFAVSAALAGLAGGLFAILNSFITPQSFLAPLSIDLVVGSIIGGSTSLFGSFVGAAFVVFVPSITHGISPALGYIIHGLALILIMMLARNGVAGLVSNLSARIAENAFRRRAAGQNKLREDTI